MVKITGGRAAAKKGTPIVRKTHLQSIKIFEIPLFIPEILEVYFIKKLLGLTIKSFYSSYCITDIHIKHKLMLLIHASLI